MVLGHALEHTCPPGRRASRAACGTFRRAQRAARAEIEHGKLCIKRFADGLYDLVDRDARERYETRQRPVV